MNGDGNLELVVQVVNICLLER